MSKKSLGKHTDNTDKKEKTVKQKSTTKQYMVRMLGLFLITITTTTYVQVMPLLFIFIGGFIGVPFETGLNQADLVVWIFSSASILIPAVYLFIVWVKYLWRRMVWYKDPKANTEA